MPAASGWSGSCKALPTQGYCISDVGGQAHNPGGGGGPCHGCCPGGPPPIAPPGPGVQGSCYLAGIEPRHVHECVTDEDRALTMPFPGVHDATHALAENPSHRRPLESRGPETSRRFPDAPNGSLMILLSSRPLRPLRHSTEAPGPPVFSCPSGQQDSQEPNAYSAGVLIVFRTSSRDTYPTRCRTSVNKSSRLDSMGEQTPPSPNGARQQPATEAIFLDKSSVTLTYRILSQCYLQTFFGCQSLGRPCPSPPSACHTMTSTCQTQVRSLVYVLLVF
ncbi:hypothetical protein C8Q77DRAFT_814677 [Trametes polyzona]|nr:hypothetical protein C8Q77DRAFT_814677 [Trametes polyzona]